MSISHQKKPCRADAMIVVVIVVPAFAQRQQRQQPVVLAGVGRLVTPRPNRCDSELMVNVSCHSSTVLKQKPHTNSGHPPIKHSTVASATGGIR